MAVYKPKRNGVESRFYVCEFVYQGKRIQESTSSTSKTVAREYERQRKIELERAAVGLPSDRKAHRIRSVSEVIKPYLRGYALSHRPKSILFANGRLAQVERLLGKVLLSDLNEETIREYITTRRREGTSGRTVNMELGELSRAIGRKWSELWPKIRKLEEQKDVGRALSPDEQAELVRALREPETVQHLRTLIPLLLLTGMRPGEALSLQWGQLNLTEHTLQVGRAKTASAYPVDSASPNG